jgi:hypothetical protein
MKGYLLIAIATAIICSTGCKKEKAVPNNGAPSSADSYMPVTSGSSWTYSINTKYSSDTLTVQMNSANAAVNGKTYYTADATPAHGGAYGIFFYQKDHVYAIRSFNTYANAVLELQLYNDTASINKSWISSPTDSGKVGTTPIRVVSTIMQKGISKVFSGKTYNNVVQVQVDIQYNLGGGFDDTDVYTYYLGKGVGILGYTSLFQGESTEDEAIISSTIK